jgi:hypothetical protein
MEQAAEGFYQTREGKFLFWDGFNDFYSRKASGTCWADAQVN